MRPPTHAAAHPTRSLLIRAGILVCLIVHSVGPATTAMGHPTSNAHARDFDRFVLENRDSVDAGAAHSEFTEPRAPVYLELIVRKPVLTPNKDAKVKIVVRPRGGANVAGLTLTLTIPPDWQSENGKQLSWPLPAIAQGEEVVVKATVKAPKENELPDMPIAAELKATVSGEGFVDVTTAQWVSVVDEKANKPGKLKVTQAGGGLINQFDDISLVVPADTFTTETIISFDSLYDWQDGVGTAPPGTIPPAVTTAAIDAPSPRWIDGIDLYKHWRLTAQQGSTDLHELGGIVELALNADNLIAAGVAPSVLRVWTRETSEDAWKPTAAHYDPEERDFYVRTGHFSEFALGAGLNSSGHYIPTIDHATVDAMTGTANVNIPIALPVGPGGSRPQLALSYSSAMADDLFQAETGETVNTQASEVGFGWTIGGLGHIVQSNETSYTPDRQLNMVLNGQSTKLFFWNLDANYPGTWETSPASFQRIDWNGGGMGFAKAGQQWVVWTGSGTKYTFGADTLPTGEGTTGFNATNNRQQLEDAATATFLVNTNTTTERRAQKWYLRRAEDTTGNLIEYEYLAERGGIGSGCVKSHGGFAGEDQENKRWYTRAIYPEYIYWGKNNAVSGSDHTLRVHFVYVDRSDVHLIKHDCDQLWMGGSNRLSEIRVEALQDGTWHRIRSYDLQQIFTADYYSGSDVNPPLVDAFNTVPGDVESMRMLLSQVALKGASGGELHSYRFAYFPLDPNRILMREVTNGWGGRTRFQYTAQPVKCSSSVCPEPARRHRYAVANEIIQETNLHNTFSTEYTYGTWASPAGQNVHGIVTDSGRFLGYPTVTKILKEQTGAVARIEWSEQVCNAPVYATVNLWESPDPRCGRLLVHDMRSPTGQSLSKTTYSWSGWWRASQGAPWSNPAGNDPMRDYFGSSDRTYPPIWVRSDEIKTVVDGATSVVKYRYELSEQNGDQFGNRTHVEEYDGGTLLRTTVTEYFPVDETNRYIVGLPARVQVYDGNDVCLGESRTIYGSTTSKNYHTQPNSAFPTRIQRAISHCGGTAGITDTDVEWQVSFFGRDGFGNVVQEKQFDDERGHVIRNTTYDSTHHIFPVEQSIGNQTESADYYGVDDVSLAGGTWGDVRQHCAVDGICRIQTTDQFGRPLTRADNVSESETTWSYIKPGQSNANTYVVTEWNTPRCHGNFTRTHYNGLGQVVAVQTAYQDWQQPVDGCGSSVGGSEVHISRDYGALGQVVRQSVPHLAGRDDWNKVTAGFASGYTLTDYDALGRPLTATAPNGLQMVHGYSRRAHSVVAKGSGGDADKIVSWTQTDALGNLASVRTYEPAGSGWRLDAEVRLTHDAGGNLTQVDHAEGRGVTRMSYDLLGRKLSMDDPDLGSGAVAGSEPWRYAYDKRSNLIQQTDGKNQTTCLYYDTLSRLVGKWFTSTDSCPNSSSTYDVRYEYDAGHRANNRSKGKLTKIWYVDNSFASTIAYDGRGQTATEAVTIQGAPDTYVTRYEYDAYLRPIKVIYPDNEQVTTLYNGMGLPVKLTSSSRGDLVDGAQNIGVAADAVHYDEAGRLTQMRFPAGGNLWRHQIYYPWSGTQADPRNGNGLLSEIRVGTNASPTGAASHDTLRYRYGYDSFANVLQVGEDIAARGIGWNTFTYDAQNRITDGYGQTYDWTPSGNFAAFEGNSMGTDDSGCPRGQPSERHRSL